VSLQSAQEWTIARSATKEPFDEYISIPGFPWNKLRGETPGEYESYVDLVPGKWTKLKIVVKGKIAKLYVKGADQPTLIVNDLKQALSNGIP
jgi:hypothetical protein